MGIVHQQRQIRDRTIDVRPNEPSEVAFADGLARLEVRLVGLEAELRSVTSLIAELASRVTKLEDGAVGIITRDVTPATPLRNARNAERQRRARKAKSIDCPKSLGICSRAPATTLTRNGTASRTI